MDSPIDLDIQRQNNLLKDMNDLTTKSEFLFMDVKACVRTSLAYELITKEQCTNMPPILPNNNPQNLNSELPFSSSDHL